LITQARSGLYPNSLSADKSTLTVSFSNLYPGERRTVLVKLNLRATENEISQQVLLSAQASFEAMSQRYSTPNSTCLVNRFKNSDLRIDSYRCIPVDAEVNRLECNEATQLALKLADEGNLTAAKAKLEQTLEIILGSISFTERDESVLALVDDLRDALRVLASREEYTSRGGRAVMSEFCSSNISQRSSCTKAGKRSIYQSPMSSAVQDKAIKSKSMTSIF